MRFFWWILNWKFSWKCSLYKKVDRFIRCPLPFESLIKITDPLVGPLMFHLEKVSIVVWQHFPSGLMRFNIRLNNRYPQAQNMMHLIPKIMVSNIDFLETEVQITKLYFLNYFKRMCYSFVRVTHVGMNSKWSPCALILRNFEYRLCKSVYTQILNINSQ